MSILGLLGRLWPHRDIVQDGKLYMRRWFIGPKLFGRRVYLHKICLSDNDRHPHDHPFDFVSIILRGSYRELRYESCSACCPEDFIYPSYDETFFPLDVLYRPAETIHRLELTNPVYTLVLRGKTERPWYFWTDKGPVPHTEYSQEVRYGRTG